MTAGWRGDVRIGPIHELDSAGPYLMCFDKDVCGCLIFFPFFLESRVRDCSTVFLFLRVEHYMGLIQDLSSGHDLYLLLAHRACQLSLDASVLRKALTILTFIQCETLVEVYLERNLTSALPTSPFSIPYRVDIS